LYQATLPQTLIDYSTLPDNRTTLERGLELALASATYSIECPYPDLLNGEAVPAHLLPYLAREKMVQVWDEYDSTPVKRSVVDQSWAVKRLAGKPLAFKRALNALNFDCLVTPWHQQNPVGQPYTIQVIGWAKNQAAIDGHNVNKLLLTLDEIKPLRDRIDFSLVFGVEHSVTFAVVASPAISVDAKTIDCQLPPLTALTPSLSVGVSMSQPIQMAPLCSSATVTQPIRFEAPHCRLSITPPLIFGGPIISS